MADSLEHRGPDDAGYFNESRVSLGFRRLSILDLKLGTQPMTNSDQSVWVVFNGEIYNHWQLRQQLIERGYNFKTRNSDTECIVHGWQEWGTELFAKLSGMFAIGIWDVRTASLVLARDRLGIKPLYLSKTSEGNVVFGSEVRALHASKLVRKRANPNGIYEYLAFQNNWHGRTPFLDVALIAPGEWTQFSEYEQKSHRFWAYPAGESSSRPQATSVELRRQHRELVDRAVASQIESDVPVSTFLSGGIDSSAITALAKTYRNDVTAFTCMFDLAQVGDDRASDEREYSRAMAKHLGIKLCELELPSRSLSHVLGKVTSALEYPRMGMSYANYMICERVARDSKVVLSGMGGDELHAGYVGRYAITPHRHYGQDRRVLGDFVSKLPRYGETLSRRFVDPLRGYRISLGAGLPSADLKLALTSAFRAEVDFDDQQAISDAIASVDSRDTWDIVRQIDIETYLAGLLVLEDKLSMAHSLETRVPLLDDRLLDFSLQLPWSELTDARTGKLILRESTRHLVPDVIFNKSKMGFGPPDASWYRNQLKDWLIEKLNADRIKKIGILRPDYVLNVLEQHFSRRRNNVSVLWTLLNLHEWAELNDFRFS